MNMRPTLCLVTLVTMSIVRHATAETPSVYGDACDASAAVAIGRGRFVVAEDEGNVLRVYERSAREPVSRLDVTQYLHNVKNNGKPAEADIEGAALVGSRVYWLSSHGRKKDGEADPFRYRFFATEIDADGGPPTVRESGGVPYDKLLDDLLADGRFEVLADAAKRKPEEKDGFNIEALAAASDGPLLIGFRNPLPEGRALVVPLRNPAAVIDRGETPAFGDAIALDLGRRGIRSFDRVGDELWIVAGPYGKPTDDPVVPAFALFRWSGDAKKKPVFVRSLDEGTFRTEALFFDADANELVLLSDDGDEQVDGQDCKEKTVPAEKKSFRARSLPMPVTAGAPTCEVKTSAKFKNSETVRLARKHGLGDAANLGVFKAPLAANTDGAPTSYHPRDYKGERLAINHIDNGITIRKSDGTKPPLADRIAAFERWRDSGDWTVPSGYTIKWQNVIAPGDDGKPCVFEHDNAGYFGSLTALKNGIAPSDAGECAVKNQLDQRFMPAIVLRGGSKNPLTTWGAKKGDLVVVVNPATGVVVPALIGDTGDDERIGEGSVALNIALQTGAKQPTTYSEAVKLDTGTRDMVVAVLPGSKDYRLARPYTRENVEERVRAWAVERGYGSLQDLAAAALECAGPL